MTHQSPRINPTSRTRLNRIPDRGEYDRQVINAILDEALICHVGFVQDDHPFVIPTIHVRIDDHVYLHGSRHSRLLRAAISGAPICLTVTLLDGLVLARSAFHHSMNYRCAVILGKAQKVADRGDKARVLDHLVEHVIKGRSADARMPSEGELNATMVVALAINEASAKLRSGPPADDDADYALPIWAGLIPLALKPGDPIPDPKLAPGIAVPDYVSGYARP
ncbi:MAG: pyridoxamine 5'-phosphate oxidase family protein [Planctomycetota bacterium]|jgi:nitroimidazol reductase NimA-like FMN-containing flavoprotein (pyridoxamine 5'-phosphate oxidase superfamily)